MKKHLIACVALLALSACATLFGDDNDKIAIHSNQGASILVNGNQVGTGSTVYSLPRDKKAIITAKKQGCSDMSVPTEQSIVGATFWNILFWPGFIVDAITGKMFKTDPTDYTVMANCGN